LPTNAVVTESAVRSARRTKYFARVAKLQLDFNAIYEDVPCTRRTLKAGTVGTWHFWQKKQWQQRMKITLVPATGWIRTHH